MLKEVKDFIETEVSQKFKNWYFNLIPSQSTVFSPDRCFLSINEETLFFLHARKTETKADLVYCQRLEYKEVDDVQFLLEEIVERRGLKGVRTTWILRPEQYQLLQIEALPVAPTEFQAAVRWKIKNLLHFPIEDALIDSFPMPPGKQPTSMNLIMLVVARQSVIQPIATQIRASGLKLSTIDIQELSFRNLTALYEKDEKSSALIFLRNDKTLLIVTHQQKLYFSRYLDLNLEAIRSALKNNDGQASVDALVNTAALDIQRSFDYYQSQWRLPEPARIFLETREPCPIDIQSLLSQRLNTAVTNIDVSRYFMNQAQLDLKQEGYFLPLLGAVIREWEQSYAAGN